MQIVHYHRAAQKRPQNASITRGCGVDFGPDLGPSHGRRPGASKRPTASWGACRLAIRRPAILGRLRTDQKRAENTCITSGWGVDFGPHLSPPRGRRPGAPKGPIVTGDACRIATRRPAAPLILGHFWARRAKRLVPILLCPVSPNLAQSGPSGGPKSGPAPLSQGAIWVPQNETQRRTPRLVSRIWEPKTGRPKSPRNRRPQSRSRGADP